MQSKTHNRGFTLIEVMIALLIFSVGLMGMAALMVVSVKTNHSAYLRTQASFLAQSMADRMRANMGVIPSYNGTYSSATTGTDPCASGVACSPANMVVRDRVLWSQQLVASLPNPTATIACNGTVLGVGDQIGASPFQGLCSLRIQWDEAALQRGATAPDAQVFSWVFQP